MKIEEIRNRSKGITGNMPDANKAEIHRRDCIALLSLIDRQRDALELAIKHIDGKGEIFSEREKIPVLYQLRQALEKE